MSRPGVAPLSWVHLHTQLPLPREPAEQAETKVRGEPVKVVLAQGVWLCTGDLTSLIASGFTCPGANARCLAVGVDADMLRTCCAERPTAHLAEVTRRLTQVCTV